MSHLIYVGSAWKVSLQTSAVIGLVAFSMGWSVPSSAATKSTSAVEAKSPRKSGKAQKKKSKVRVPAQAVSYSCQVRLASGQTSETQVLTTSIQFQGLSPHQLITVNQQDGVRTMIVNEFFDSPQNPYIVESIGCDTSLNCESKRSNYSRTGERPPRVRVIPILPGTTGARAQLGTRNIFSFENAGTGFIVRYGHLGGAAEEYSLILSCEGSP